MESRSEAKQGAASIAPVSSFEMGPEGPVATMAARYTTSSRHLLGYVVSMSYEVAHIVTCDKWKQDCGGLPRNSFALIKLSPTSVGLEYKKFCNTLALIRFTGPVPTPTEREVQETIYQIHKLQAAPDAYTHKELQWSVMGASVLGTFYDTNDEQTAHIAFGADTPTFFSPHCYEAYVPVDKDLELLINAFVDHSETIDIGELRYTETPVPGLESNQIRIRISPEDIVGKEFGARTALFGKTRGGKSNTIKVISDFLVSSRQQVGQVIFDASGEYTYVNPQDGTSIYARNPGRCFRYSIAPRSLSAESALGLPEPLPLKINYYEQPPIGHALIKELWNVENDTRPGYMKPILDWEPSDLTECPSLGQDPSGYKHFWRTMSMWFAALKLAGYSTKVGAKFPVDFPKRVKAELVSRLEGLPLSLNANSELCTVQPVDLLPLLYREVARIYDEHGEDAKWFPPSSATGSAYFNEVEEALLQILRDDGSISGKRYLTPFRKYHDKAGSDVFRDISDHARDGETVIIDLAQADEKMRRNLTERICRQIRLDAVARFHQNIPSNPFVVLYFEEAHQLFPNSDRDLDNEYNKLAKEGAKFRISMVYATQSITTMSPDLLKNTDNFFVAHLDDDREVRELTRKHAFRNIAEDVLRSTSRGFVRMLTASHPFAVPVQIRRFGDGQ